VPAKTFIDPTTFTIAPTAAPPHLVIAAAQITSAVAGQYLYANLTISNTGGQDSPPQSYQYIQVNIQDTSSPAASLTAAQVNLPAVPAGGTVTLAIDNSWSGTPIPGFFSGRTVRVTFTLPDGESLTVQTVVQ
jgi:hypothetical protein